MGFDIVTYCSQNYMPSLDLFLPRLNVSGADRIVVYTDEGNGNYSNRPNIKTKTPVEYLAYFPKCNEWIKNVGRLPEAVEDYVMMHENGRKFVFVGTDCVFVRNVADVFNSLSDDKWIGVYRLDSFKKTVPDTFFAILNDQSRKLIHNWHNLSKCFRDCGIGVNEGFVAYDQLSFDYLVLAVYLEQCFWLNDKILMNSADDVDEWKRSVEQLGEKVCGLHFKGQRWKDKNLVNEILRLAKVL